MKTSSKTSSLTPGSDLPRAVHLTLVLWAMGCTASPPEGRVSAQGKDDTATEPCVNSIPTDVMPDTEPEFGVAMPAREEALPTLLSETGLYADITSKEINAAVSGFTPRFQLWSDGADKSRWVYLPECEEVDTSEMNDWRFPVGTRFFKEFAVDGARIETRLIERIGEGPRDFVYASYQWDETETEAT
ncbi:MAG: hypothetical protein QGG40_18725, partial [Myxococcota bacterium]|nr:hypothetical protein [Myxococcota bacterium]